MPNNHLSSEFLRYLASRQAVDGEAASPACEVGEEGRLPSLHDLSAELGVSVALLREQLEVAKAIGLVEVRPRTGIRCLPYTFRPAVHQSLSYAIAIDWDHFLDYADLRNHIEAAYWDEAARCLTPEDQRQLQSLVERAWEKLKGHPVQIPHTEHRLLHLMIYSRLENPFVQGLLEAYWAAYEAVGLNLYAGYDYLKQVWDYHQQMVEAIIDGDYERGYQALTDHKDLLFHRAGVAEAEP
jgi:DNA-binding FadR family transcriptional regulator